MQFSPVINTYDTKQDVVAHTSGHLSEHFCLAYSALCYHGQLFDDLGFMGDTDCAKQILEGSYNYPLDTGIWTKKILQEAHYTFSKMSGTEIAATIITEDFQYFWQRVDERTSSSFNGITFLHEKAVALHPMLAVMHAAYLMACALKGVVDPQIPGNGQTIPRPDSHTHQHHLNVAQEPSRLS
jgi:hypothetical protein